MEDHQHTLSLIHHGCSLAKDLESNLPNLANQPNMISKSCDEIIRVFTSAKERLSSSAHQDLTLYPHHLLFGQHQNVDPSLQELLRSSYSQAMDLIQTQILASGKSPFDVNVRVGARDHLEGGVTSTPFRGGIAKEVQVTDVSKDSSNRGSSSSQRSARRRKDDAEKRTIMVPAPQIGNTEIPPEDGYTWRKYGQKEILGSRFPRGYYRCTHQKLYQCPAKKLVQRLDADPYTFEVTYRGDHTCHMSSTAPSIAPPPFPPLPEVTLGMSQSMTTTHIASVPLSTWLSTEFSLRGGSSGGGDGGAGPSTSRYDKEIEYPVADMADAMFNSGSSSSSMEFIFPPMEDHK